MKNSFVMNALITILAILLISNLIVYFFKKWIYPEILLILVGILLSTSFFKDVILGNNLQVLFHLGNFGLLFIMFIAGLESSWSYLYKEKHEAALIAIFSFLTPFLLGFMVFYSITNSFTIAFVVGICMSITAEAAKAKALLDVKKLKTRIGSAIMGAGILDDVFGLLLFTSLIFFTRVDLSTFLRHNALFLGAILSYVFGLIVHKHIGRSHKHVGMFEKFISITLVPFFFISLGLIFDFSSLVLNPMLLGTVLLLAMAGKFMGVFFSGGFLNLGFKKLFLIGWAMNSRGAIEMVIAYIAYESNLIPIELFSSLLIMALITTLIFPFVIKRMVKTNKGIMN
ncbi:cation:proton antiporter [Candidatus Woesearchaeota archaeon]|nr:cation:proton antiporter [Candidatus Woesearchaeota archaeon]